MEVKPLEIIDCEVLPYQVKDGRKSISTIEDTILYKCNFPGCTNRLSYNPMCHEHSGEELFKCDMCDYASMYLSNLESHKLLHSGIKLYKCDTCDYACNRLYVLRNHKLTHSKERGRPYKCDVCNYSCCRSDMLKTHKLIHSGEKHYKCNSCDYGCYRLNTLKSHKLIHSKKRKPYKCDICNYVCCRSDILRNHKLAHSGVKLYKCDDCDYACNRLYRLKQHKLVHSKEKPYKCDSCDYACYCFGTLKTHKLVHGRVKLYKLNASNDYAGNDLDWLKHYNLVHKRASTVTATQMRQENRQNIIVEQKLSTETLETIHGCIDCPYYTSSVSRLQNHLLKHCVKQKILEKLRVDNVYPDNT